MTKKILIDMTVLAQGTRTGVFRVAHELVTRLQSDPKFEVFLTLTQEDEFRRRDFDLREGLRAYCRESGLEARFIDAGVDPAFTDIEIYLSPFFKVPHRWAEDERVVKAVVAYDLIPIYYPEFCQAGIIDLVTEFFDHIGPDWLVFSISECTKQDLLAYRPDISERQVIVTHLGADERFRPGARESRPGESLERAGIPRGIPYVLSVATLEIRKNLVSVLQGFSRYLEQADDTRTLLVLAGMKGWKLESLEQQLQADRRLHHRVILTGFVEERDLPALYAGASVFVFMSHYEGFGLPPLEAMSCGVPVICSNTSSLPEVVGNAAISLPPGDSEGLADALEAVLSDDALHGALAEKSREQASGFSWKRFGDQVSRALGQVRRSPLPALSIITICYNEPQIRDTCESIKRQAFRNFEWIVVDGGSNAETLAVLEEYREFMSVFISEPDKGRYDAMNKGIRASRGTYLLFLNGGDYLHDELSLSTVFSFSSPLETMDIFCLKLNAPVVYGEVITRETGMFPHPMWKTGPQTHDLDFFKRNSLPHQATFIRRDLFDRYGPYDESLQYAADYEWFIRTLCYHGIQSQYLPAVVSVYNFEGASSASTDANAPHIVEIREIAAHYLDPDISSDWPHRSGAKQGPATPIPTRVHPGGADLDQEFADQVLDLASGRLGSGDLKQLLRQCRDTLNHIGSSEGQPLGPPPGNVGDVARASVTLLINRLRQSALESEDLSDKVRHRRTLIRVRERLMAEIQKRLTRAVPRVTESPPNIERHPLMKFTRHLGLNKPPLLEPEEYHLAQMALRAASREKYAIARTDAAAPSETGP
jgi:glycosyltransferase involved in cell wall biosynthesis